MKKNPYQVLLYYKYTSISDPDRLRQEQYDFCDQRDIKGRILIADEGINGTVAGDVHALQEYQEFTQSHPEIGEVEWKISSADEQVFPKLKVKVRPEIVTLGLRKADMDVHLENKAHYIEPAELLELYEKQEDFVILDARNVYEAKIGKFKNALIPPIDNFRDFPKFAQKISDYKDKPVVTYCTGGIRCEKASAYLREQGFQDVRQLHGGIHRYSDETGGKYFQGEMFVFDKRLNIPVNHVDPEIISECEHCGTKIARYVDCTKLPCHRLYICCEDCEDKTVGRCGECVERSGKVESTTENIQAVKHG